MTTPKQSQPTLEELPLAELEKITGGRSAGWFPGDRRSMGVLGGLAGAAASPFDPGAGPSMDDAFAALGFGVQVADESGVAWHDVADAPPSFIVGESPAARAVVDDEEVASAAFAAIADLDGAELGAGRDDAAVGIGADDLVADAADSVVGSVAGDDADYVAAVQPGSGAPVASDGSEDAGFADGRDDAAVGIGADDLVANAADGSDLAAEVEPGDADVAERGDAAVVIGADDLVADGAMTGDGIGELDGISLADLAIRDDDADVSAADSGSFDAALLATDDLAAIDDAQLEAAYAAATAELLGEAPMYLDDAVDDSGAPPLHLDEHAVASLDAPMFLDDLDVRDAFASM